MDRRMFLHSLAGGLLAVPRALRAQGGKRIVRIGILVWANTRSASFYVAMEKRLSQLSYVEGRNLHVEFRTAGGDHAKLPGLLRNLLEKNAMC